MLLAQITDIHIGFDRQADPDPNLVRFEAVLDRVLDGPNRPDAVLLSGDLTEHGDAESYALLARALERIDVPLWPMAGNHDERMAEMGIFPDLERFDEFIQYSFDCSGVRVLALDTTEPGRHAGAFCDRRARWLSDELAHAPEVPTVIAMHHPPFAAGIEWMDPAPRSPWIVRFEEAIQGHAQIAGVICGHLHRECTAMVGAVPVRVAPSCAPAVALHLGAIDPEQPDDRVLITDEAAGYALHRWDGTRLITFTERIGSLIPLARFNAGLQGMVRGLKSEAP